MYKEFLDTATSRQDSRSQEQPERIGDYLYYTKFKVYQNQTVMTLYRKHDSQNSKEELIFSPAVDKVIPNYNLSTYNLSKMSLNDSQDKIAFLIDLRNSERPTCFIKDLKTGKIFKEQLENCSDVVWSYCGKYLYYIKKDEQYRPARLFKHKLGDTFQDTDEEVFYAEDERHWVDIRVSKDKAWFF